MNSFDVIVAGGGIAGSTSAVALARQGHRVLVCEAGLPSTKRLAGELVHAPGAANLERLGMLDDVRKDGGVPVYGFTIFQSADDPGTMLSYSEIPGGFPTGIAMEHGKLTRRLLKTARAVPGVTVWEGARVVASKLGPDGVVATITRDKEDHDKEDHDKEDHDKEDHDKEDIEVTAKLMVSAEGRKSALRDNAGIEVESGEPFRMLGWKIPGARLPYPGYGHVFTGGPSPILAYQMAHNDVRIMFELALDEGMGVSDELLQSIPEPFRGQVEAAIAKEAPTSARVFSLTPRRVSSERFAVVGDAGGCVHPLTASGMAFCVGDAVRLADAIGTGARDLSKALKTYERSRVAPMRSRTALGPAMVEALCSKEPAMRLLRHGLFRYWQRDMRGRGASLGLLATSESRITVMAREYATVCANALTGLPNLDRAELVPAVVGLARRTADLAFEAARATARRA